jgi:hypothetical protein
MCLPGGALNVLDNDGVKRTTGSTPTELSISVSKGRFAAGSAAVGIIARNNLLADAFVGGPLANRTDATLLLTDTSMLLPEVLAELDRAVGKGKLVYLLGREAALSPGVEQALQAAGYPTRRLGGEDRLQTATFIADEIVSKNPAQTRKYYVTEHSALVDALGTGAVAGDRLDGTVDPILLQRRGAEQLDPSLQSYVGSHPGIGELEIVGGTDAVSSAAEAALRNRTTGAQVVRTSGPNRFATNVALASAHFSSPKVAYVVNGERDRIVGALSGGGGSTGFFGALLAGPAAAAASAPLIITRTNDLPVETLTYLQANAASITGIVIVGSLLDVSQSVEQLLATFT